MSVLDLRLLLILSAAVALTFFVAVRVRDLARLLISWVRKAGLLWDAAVLATTTCPGLVARCALQLIEQIAIGLDLFRGAFEEPCKARQIACERLPVGRVVLRQNMMH